MNPQIEQIKEKLGELKGLDKEFRLFGASSHKYKLNNVLSFTQIEEFEKKYGITLPVGYKEFLLKIGDGGAGPNYGLVKLEDSLFADMDFKNEDNKTNPSLPFPHTEPQMMFNEDFDEEKHDEEAFEEIWGHPHHNYGILRLSNGGCGIFTSLVVNGEEYGNLWIDDRGSDAGIYPANMMDDKPERINFLDWYETWLDQSINSLKK